MVRNTLTKHKETAIIYEESGSVIINYNALITHPKSKLVTQLVISYTIAKQ
jgi:mannitol/fructose-specific phosphotransferase system IIA component (Ntr-type)